MWKKDLGKGVMPPWIVPVTMPNFDGQAKQATSSSSSFLGPDDPAFVIACEEPLSRKLVYFCFCLFTCGLGWLASFWLPGLKGKICYVRTDSISRKASFFLVVARNGKKRRVGCQHLTVSTGELSLCLPSRNASTAYTSETPVSTALFVDRCIRYMYNAWTGEFEPVDFGFSHLSPAQVHAIYGTGLSQGTTKTLLDRQEIYGPACVDVPIEPLFKLVKDAVLHPFSVFQVAVLILWFWDGYIQYATALSIVTIVSLLAELVQTRLSQVRLRNMSRVICDVRVLRKPLEVTELGGTGGKVDVFDSKKSFVGTENATLYQTVSSADLVPGDVIELQRNMVLPCDIVLLQGSAIVNEAMLTGETVPVQKSALPLSDQVPLKHSKIANSHSLFGGTELVDARKGCASGGRPAGCFGLVIRGGYRTKHGLMMRAVLFPPEKDAAEFQSEALQFLAVLAAVGAVAFFATLVITTRYGLQPQVVFIRSADALTTAIPPALPVTMTVGATLAVTKLRRSCNVVCTVPSKINVAGQVNTLVFDKTGTLTDDYMELECVVPVVRKISGSASDARCASGFFDSPKDHGPIDPLLAAGMACCQNLAVVDGRCTGEPIEIEMLNWVQWKFVEQRVRVAHHSKGSIDELNSKDVDSALKRVLDHVLPCQGEVYQPRDDEDGKPIVDLESRGGPLIEKTNSSGSCYTTSDDLSEIEAVGSALLSALPRHLWRIARRFEFTAALQRMSVLAYNRRSAELVVFCKGAPEQLLQLSRPDSVPANATAILRPYVGRGMRVLAIAYRYLDVHKELLKLSSNSCGGALLQDSLRQGVASLERENVEKDLIFGGFIVFANSLKAGTRAAIQSLRSAGCRCIVATGDNLLTATAVARDSRILDADAPLLTVDISTENGSDVVFSAQNGQLNFTVDPISWLAGQDPRRIAFAVSGKALSRLRALHLQADIAWAVTQWNTGVEIESRITRHKRRSITWEYQLNREKRRFAATRKPQNNNDWDLEDPSEKSQLLVSSPSNVSTLKVSETVENDASLKPGYLKMVSVMIPSLATAARASICFKKLSLSETLNGSIERNGSQKGSAHIPDTPDAKPVGQLPPHLIIMSIYEMILRHCRVYARMSPEQKAELISALRSLPGRPLVGMCGDGANDCAALRTADLAVSLSQNEASIAAPFTATRRAPEAVVNILCEGRGALANSFQSFKYIALYALVQTLSCCVLYSFGGNLSDSQFLWVDLAIVIPLSMTMAWTQSAEKLVSVLPGKRLVGLPVTLSLIGQGIIQILFLLAALRLLAREPFYVRYQPDPNVEHFSVEDLASYENTIIFIVSNFQYINLNLVLAWAKPWRKHPFTNIWHTVICFGLLAVSVYGFLFRAPFLEPFCVWLGLVNLPSGFVVKLAALILMNLICIILYEHIVIGSWILRREQARDVPAHYIDAAFPLDRDLRVTCSA